MLLSLLLTLALQTRTPQDISGDLRQQAITLRQEAEKLDQRAGEVEALGLVQPENLQAALDKGGTITLDPTATYAGTFVVKSDTTLITNKAKFTGSPTGPTLLIVGNNVYVSGFTFIPVGTVWDQSVVQIGYNDSRQTSLASVPTHVTIIGANIPSYRGKRGIEINGADVKILQSVINDVYDPSLQTRDSQAIVLLNGPGPLLIDENDLSAGSENILIAGDSMKLVGPNGERVFRKGITITRNHIWKPLSWQTDGVSRVVKNLVELKDGTDVLIANNTLDGSWKNGQDGYCFVITPRAGGDIHNVLIEDNSCTHVAAGVQILGNDGTTAKPWGTPSPISGLVIRRLYLNANHLLYGGRGILALITGGPHDVTFDDVTAITTGGSIIQLDKSGSYLAPDGTIQPTPRTALLSITNSRLVSGTYGLIINGANNDWHLSVDTLTFIGNTVADASGYLKKWFPTGNTYITRVDFDPLVIK